jgi:transposase
MATTTDEFNVPVGCVVLGVDTHGETHHAALVDHLGRHLGDAEFAVTPAGYRGLLAWAQRHGAIVRAGVEGTGSYGAGLARYLHGAGVVVIEVNRPDRSARRMAGKSDPLDAYAAARAVLNGSATGLPKSRAGAVEAIRVLRVARRGAVKARTQTVNQLKALIITAPEDLRERLAGLSLVTLVRVCAQLRPGATGAQLSVLANPALAATKAALRRLARRYQQLTDEIAELDAEIHPLVKATAPQLLALQGVGPEVAGQLLATAGDNPDRLRSEASFAHLCGVAPLPASSGRTRRHRLNRGGDRAANNALYTIVLTRLRLDPRTHAYVARRTAEGLTSKEIVRCLKRHVAREVYRALLGAAAPRLAGPLGPLDRT